MTARAFAVVAAAFAAGCSVVPPVDGGLRDSGTHDAFVRDAFVRLDAGSDAGPRDAEVADVDSDCVNGMHLRYADCDGDGDGRPFGDLVSCAAPAPPTCDMTVGQWVTTNGDCDDTDRYLSSHAPELCNGRDDDCDGLADEAPAPDSCVHRFEHATGTCAGGACRIVTCDMGWTDCLDGAGCVVDLTTDRDHCGSCIGVCTPWAACVAGTCAPDPLAALAVTDTAVYGSRASLSVYWWSTTYTPSPVRVDWTHAATELAARGDAACAAQASDDVACIGLAADYPFPTPSSPYGLASIPGTAGARSLALGERHACAIAASGGVLCWGENRFGALGDGTTTARSAVVHVTGLDDAVALAAGGRTSCAVRASGAVACWGARLGATGVDTTPVDVPGLSGVTALALSDAAACAVAGGAVRCWGDGSAGELGDGTTDVRALPAAASGIDDATLLAGGAHHFCAVRASGAVACWGANDAAQLAWYSLGTGPCELPTGPWVDCRTTPTDVRAVDDATAIAASPSRTCVLRASGPVSCWGRGDPTVADLRAL